MAVPALPAAALVVAQPDEWVHMAALHSDNLELLLVEQLARELDHKGSLHVLRHGFRFYGRRFRLAFFAPVHGLTPDTLARFERNELTVTRQVPCHPGSGDTLDLVFALNGMPVATCELKNPMTGQTWRDAVRQYRKDRDPNAPIFRIKRRTLVHFAADPDEVHMTTRLAGDWTLFLPFNRGSDPGGVHCGAGNPPNPDGCRTEYFWREVLGSRAQEAAGNVRDWEDGLNAVVESRGPQPNLSFFAFTATPKGKIIELFGQVGLSGRPEPFHVYSMRQAIEEGFILDVLQHYIDYDAYYRIVKAVEDIPEFQQIASKELAREIFAAVGAG